MKILAIRLKNLASIEGTYEIDFTTEPLLSAGIFAISGPTGSGKSTILDALCLALFDKAPRFAATSEKVTLFDVGEDRIQQTDVRNILRRGMGEGFAEVDFLGVDGRRYSSRWAVYRARRKPSGSLQSQTLAVKNIDTDEALQGTKTELLNRISSLLGLTYEQFTRTVLLAQNDFATFLKSRDDAKAELLEKLTGTEVYSRISMVVFAHNKEAQSALNDLQLRMGEVNLLSGEELAVLEKDKKEYEKEKAEKLNSIRLMEQKKKWHEQYFVLQWNAKQAETILKEAEKVLSDASERIELLARIDSVQGAMPLVIEKGNLEQTLSVQKQQLQQAAEELAVKNAYRLRQQELHTGLEEKVKNIQTEIQAIMPVIIQVRALDVRLADMEKTLAKAELESQKADSGLQVAKDAYAGKKKQSEALSSRIKLLDEWIARYESHSAMIGRMEYVFSLLEKGESSGKKLRAADALLKGLDASLQNAKNTLNVLKEKQMVSDKHLVALKNDQDVLTGQLEDKNIDEIRKRIEELLSLREKLMEAQRIKANDEAEEKEIAGWKKKQTEWNKELVAKNEEIIRLTGEIKVMRGQLEVVGKLHDNARMALSENVTRLRQNLEAGQPCPVCGSTEHPYTADEKVDLVLRKVLEEFNSLTENLEKLNHRNIGLIKDTDYLGARLKEADTEIKAHSLMKEEQLSLLSRLTIGLPEDISLPDQLREVSMKLDSLKGQEKEYAELAKKVKIIGQQIKEVLAEDEQLKESVRQQEQLYRTLLAEREKESALQEQYRTSYDEAVRNAGQEISLFDWQSLWLDNPAAFREQLQKLHRLWTEKHAEIEDVRVQYQKLATELDGDTKLLHSLTDNAVKTRQAAESIRSTFELLKSERTALLSDRTADGVEQEYQSRLQQTQNEYNASAGRLADVSNICSGLEGQIRQIESGIKKHEEELVNLKQNLQQWLDKYNMSAVLTLSEWELIELLSGNADWINSERQALNDMQNACTKAKATLEERQKQFLKHLTSDNQPDLEKETEDWLAEHIVLDKQGLEAIEKELTLIQSKLLLQQQNKEQLRHFEKELKEKQEIAGRWAKLNDFIGQANGEKFKVIAQGYTLGLLLRHANKHLGYLSPRYKLQQVPGSLALQVIDRDMCDEIRTVYSLSGGESFLISLALALGLSSLSSNNMKVESLFIDEGFGSLDTDSLRLAMDALEQLQTQGRKIGVISHVKEMSERISTQIVLSRTANGRSKVSVIGR